LSSADSDWDISSDWKAKDVTARNSRNPAKFKDQSMIEPSINDVPQINWMEN
jgi:hypothetical protein